VGDGSAGNVGGPAGYDPYGVPEGTSAPAPFGYTGELQDPSTGLVNLRARTYNPLVGQFLMRDPLEQQTGQAYAYAGGDPVNNADPSGKDSEQVEPASLSTFPAAYAQPDSSDGQDAAPDLNGSTDGQGAIPFTSSDVSSLAADIPQQDTLSLDNGRARPCPHPFALSTLSPLGPGNILTGMGVGVPSAHGCTVKGQELPGIGDPGPCSLATLAALIHAIASGGGPRAIGQQTPGNEGLLGTQIQNAAGPRRLNDRAYTPAFVLGGLPGLVRLVRIVGPRVALGLAIGSEGAIDAAALGAAAVAAAPAVIGVTIVGGFFYLILLPVPPVTRAYPDPCNPTGGTPSGQTQSQRPPKRPGQRRRDRKRCDEHPRTQIIDGYCVGPYGIVSNFPVTERTDLDGVLRQGHHIIQDAAVYSGPRNLDSERRRL